MKADEVYSKLKKMIGLVSVGISNTTSIKNPDGSVTITINFTSGSPLSFTMSPVKGDKGIGIKDALIKEILNGTNTEYHLILVDDKNNNIDAGKIPISSGGSVDLSNYTTKDNSIKSINLVDAIPTGSISGYKEKCLQLIFADDTKIVNVSVEDLVDSYDDTQVKSDINDLKSDKQDKTDNSLETTDRTLVGAINTINGNQLDTITFSSDYKNIIINRKSGLNPYTIPISSIIHNVKITELNDVDSTDIGDGKTLIYDSAAKKHKYVNSTGTDELVKMDSTTDAKHLGELIDKSTVVNDNGVLKVKKLDGQQVTIAEINYLKGLTMNVMDLVNAFANGGVKVLNTPVNTHADLSTLDRSTFLDGISYIVYVLADETHSGAKTTYLCDKTSSTFFGNADSQRNFVTNPIDLANEVTGKLSTSNIDVDALWNLLTINNTYKTLTTKDEVFGTHGAKALYDELVAEIGKKANATDLTKHTSDTGIHITTSERIKWNKVDNKVDKTDITTTIDSTSTDSQVPSAKSVKAELDKKVGTDKIGHVDGKYVCADSPIINSTMYRLYGGNNLVGFQKFINFGTSSTSIEWNYTLFHKDYGLCPKVLGEGKDLNDLHMNCFFTANNKCLNIPDVSKNFFGVSLCHIGVNVYSTQICVSANENQNTTMKRTIYVRDSYNEGWGDWRTISATSVADVPVTNIAPADTTTFVNFVGNASCNYYVKNGVCYVSLWGVKIASTGRTIKSGVILPKCANNRAGVLMTGTGDAIAHAFAFIVDNGELCFDVKDANTVLYGSFSYPVAE